MTIAYMLARLCIFYNIPPLNCTAISIILLFYQPSSPELCSMKAIILQEFGDEVLVQVHALSINPVVVWTG